MNALEGRLRQLLHWLISVWRGRPWEKRGLRAHLICLVGHEFGERPEERWDEIVASKAHMADWLAEQARLEESSQVIEIGCGMGLISCGLAPRVGHLFATDVSSSFLTYARQTCASLENVSFHQVRHYAFPFCRDNSVDAVVSHAVFIHLDLFGIYWYLNEAFRVLRPGGVILFEINSLTKLDLERDHRFHTMAGLARTIPGSLKPELMSWNCPATVENMALHLGFLSDPVERDPMAQPEVFRLRKPEAHLQA